MKSDYLQYIKEKKELVSVVLLGVSVLLLILMFVKVTDFLGISAQAQNIIRTAVNNENSRGSESMQFLQQDREFAEALIEDNIFVPPVREAVLTNPIQQVTAIIGNKIWINDGDRSYSVGDTYQDAAIVAISATEATFEWNGNEYVYSPLDVEISYGQEDARGGGRAGTSSSTTIVAGRSQPTNLTGVPIIRTDFIGMDPAELERLRSQMTNMMGGGRGGFGGDMGFRGGMGGRGGRGGRGRR